MKLICSRFGKNFMITEMNVHVVIKEMAQWIRRTTGGRGVVLGLSGGLDSAVMARLIQEAGIPLKAYLMPDGTHRHSFSFSKDYVDAVEFAKKFDIDHETIPIGSMRKVVQLPDYHKDVKASTPEDRLLAGTNVASLLRMVMLDQQAKLLGGYLVVGTTNLSELVSGYFSKRADGACDFNPLARCTKLEVYILAHALGVTEEIISKAPSAGLIDGQTDEGDLGFTYNQLESWIMYGTCEISRVDEMIEKRYLSTMHKRMTAPCFEGFTVAA